MQIIHEVVCFSHETWLRIKVAKRSCVFNSVVFEVGLAHKYNHVYALVKRPKNVLDSLHEAKVLMSSLLISS